MFKIIRDNPLLLFMLRLFGVTILSSILWIVIIYFYNEYKIASNMEYLIEKKTKVFLKKFDKNDLEYISQIIKNNEDVISLEIYDDSLKQILNIKKKKNDFLLKKILEHFDTVSMDTKYKLIPLYKDDMYIYFQSQIKIEGLPYYLNILLKIDDKTINLIREDIQLSIITVIITICIVFIFIFPIIYSQYKSLIKKKNELLQSNINTLISLGNAVAKRDSDTSSHNYRVTYYSIKIAQKLNLSNEQIKTLIKGAFLHDIGKIAISDNILLKPAKLTNDEFEIIKTHVTHGVEIVQNNTWLQDAKDVILYHHEKVDGSGYPDGLKGDEIPYLARIFAVADVFDALTSKRPYKKSFSLDESIKIIRDDSGSHFDKDVVDTFEEIYENIYYDILDISSSNLEDILCQNMKPYFDIRDFGR